MRTMKTVLIELTILLSLIMIIYGLTQSQDHITETPTVDHDDVSYWLMVGGTAIVVDNMQDLFANIPPIGTEYHLVLTKATETEFHFELKPRPWMQLEHSIAETNQ